jgi:DNA polymerase V
MKKSTGTKAKLKGLKTNTSIHACYRPEIKTQAACPVFDSKISAGFPSPADDFIDKKLDLNDLLIRHSAATFFVRVSGDSMTGAGINNHDILIVDRSLELTDKKIIIAIVNGEMTVKRFRIINEKKYLVAENPAYKPIEVNEKNTFQLWGIVTSVIHQV